MRRTLSIILLAAVVLMGIASSLQAQVTYMTRTTLSAAVSAEDRVITVGSNTGFTVGQFVYIDAESMEITAINGTSITVNRGQLGTGDVGHANSEAVFTGANQHFQQTDPDYGAACAVGVGEALYLPRINQLSGIMWTCITTTWTGTSTALIVYDSTRATLP